MAPRKLFRDRHEAGRKLAVRLRAYAEESPVVLGLPRGGVVVAYEVARELGAPLDVCVVRKIGAPIRPELGIGAVAEGDVVYVDQQTARLVGLSDEDLGRLLDAKRGEVEERIRGFRRGAPPIDVHQKTVVLVDDGLATGGTARAALRTLRARGARKLVLAVPVGASDSLDDLATEADDIVCLHAEEPLFGVGVWYEDFGMTTDEEVVDLLDRANLEQARAPRMRSERVRAQPVVRDVRIPLADAWLDGILTLPVEPTGLVLFAHGSGSSRFSTRNRYVSEELARAGLATLLFDLLTEHEGHIDARTAKLRFDVDLLATRLLSATDWVLGRPDTKDLALGYFGASTGAAAALVAAAKRPDAVRAVVSRGGRPDLAEAWLGDVKAPTLLLVGGADPDVLRLNRESLYLLGCEKELEVVPDATHLFEEPGALEHVARSATLWFVRYLGAARLEVATTA